MRRSTAAAVGTLTGAALIVGVRLSVTPLAAPAVAAPIVDLANSTPSPKPSGSKKETGKKKETEAPAGEATNKTGLKDGVYKGKAATNQYGTVQVSIKIENGEITVADATYPVTGNSATINPNAVAKLKQETLKARDANVAAVSGATYTSKSYAESLQAALDAAKA